MEYGLVDVLQVIVIMAGLLPDVATSVAVMGVSFDITTITYMLPSGISGTFLSTAAEDLQPEGIRILVQYHLWKCAYPRHRVKTKSMQTFFSSFSPHQFCLYLLIQLSGLMCGLCLVSLSGEE